MNKIDYTNLKKSLNSLKEVWAVYKEDNDIKYKSFIKDSCIKRFEYTLEIYWKMMKK